MILVIVFAVILAAIAFLVIGAVKVLRDDWKDL